jgi:ParB family transcriptional regulator, chromosome partitioning protein
MREAGDPAVQMIPISQISVINPRSRNQFVFQSIVSNIGNLGLKKPITVARQEPPTDGKLYNLVCGQGRLEAYVALGQTEVPAIIVEASRDDCFLMSLVENVARRRHSPFELLREISSLKSRGYKVSEIAKKIDVAVSYVTGIVHLLSHGEERLVTAVDKGRIPLTVALKIADADEESIQKALCEAYEDRSLRGRRLLTVRSIIDLRKARGKKFNMGVHPKRDRPISAEALVRAYRQESDRQKLLVRKAQLTETRLVFVVSALKKLLADQNFTTLLRAEGLDTLPAYLAERVQVEEKVSA